MSLPQPDWLHGRLEGDDAYLANWSFYLSTRLGAGIQIDDAEFIALRLMSLAHRDVAARKISISAGADLTLIARSLQEICTAFRTAFPSGDAVRARLGVIEDPFQLLRKLVTLAHNGEDAAAWRVSIYWDLRREARAAYKCCNNPETITGWPQLISAWLWALIKERIVYRYVPASMPDGSGPDPRVKELFSEDEQEILEKIDAELEEGFADIVTALVCYGTDEVQSENYAQVLAVHATDGRLEARRLLRDMSRDFRATPWNFKAWDAKLKQMNTS
ncbi:hypothetical protein O4160_25645 [Rhodococcus sp. IEGM 1401]|uniref:hypothetical protein n=1 Tax=unclassified Rhodococcus (in: high G+C Gram-positive bacteria) TaxID=192944 RepID=UPI001FB281B5|nr:MULTISPECIES: hypothetical protein [unclassified Rhodococcus (in: high G+C Gram-positive bacteria)]MCJ0980972.1 hypothetical protein [Rhodococcus sp. ARC_M12]MCZ4564225.1 hypothetical protein [Rhodococcus sp. IEGM 1401]MDI9924355.1 hypothetical protein [Rhodococcus sp. IEGM 1372]MDV8036802.1 hypothetical protein [Rhodococcus sp. IEGM 1414]